MNQQVYYLILKNYIYNDMTINIISLGSECDVCYQIAKYYKSSGIRITHFFDWLISDMNSIINILSNEIGTILIPSNIKQIGEKGNNIILIFRNCGKLISMHDVPLKYSINDIFEFISKYKRRYFRFMNILKSKDKTYLIRRDNPKDEKINELLLVLNKINTNNNIYLIFLRTDITSHIIYNKRVIFLNFNKFKLNNKQDWQRNNYAWNLIFDFIVDISKAD